MEDLIEAYLIIRIGGILLGFIFILMLFTFSKKD